MNKQGPGPELSIQKAAPADAALLILHHRKMFAEIFTAKGAPATEEQLSAIDTAYGVKLDMELFFFIRGMQ